jgi:hypothetical protein
MEVSYTIDWLSVTSDRAHYHDDMTMYYIERERGSKGYTVAIEFEDGRIELLHPDRPEMGVHVEYSGSALETIEGEYGVPKIDVLRLGGDAIKTARLDIAIDVIDGGLKVSDLVVAMYYDKLNSNAKKVFEIKSIGEPGHTLYIGAPSSQARLRIYDKAAEQGVPGDWLRIELQLRSKKARDARQVLLDAHIPAATVTGIINGFARFDLPKWREIMGSDIQPASPADTAEHGTEKWLLTTVAKTLARVVSKEGGDDFLRRFNASVDEYFQEVRGSRKERLKT